MITLKYIMESDKLNFDDSFEAAKLASSIVDSHEGRELIIHVLDIWKNVDELTKDIWTDLIERAGFYPYFVNKIESQSYKGGLQAKIRSAYFKSDFLEGVYFHERQKEIEVMITDGQNVAVSAPTSFGKSLLIEEVVAKNEFSNILIIQPTLALIDETRKKLKKYSEYNIVVNTRQNPKSKNIFILTAERVLEFPQLPNIDFFVVDEFYKISNRRNDDRITALNVALYKIMATGPQALFLTPTVDSISLEFREKYNVSFYKTDYQLVNTRIHEIREDKPKLRKLKLFQYLESSNEQSIVYVRSPNEAYKLAKEYLNYLVKQGKHIEKNKNLDIFEWIDENISSEWLLKTFLKNRIGAHNGALPRHIVTSEIELFNSGHLDVLFATTSLIEGVNTSAKNMFIFNKQKGNATIDFFDFSNIKGRAGRMLQHYTGDVYLFHGAPSEETFVIDVPVIDQTDISDEVLINVNKSDAKDEEKFEQIREDIPIDLLPIVQKNLVSILGQKNLVKLLENKFEGIKDFMNWTGVPDFNQLEETLTLAFYFIKNESNSKYIKQQTLLALRYAKMPLKEFIDFQTKYYSQKGDNNPLEKAIDEALKFQRNMASFEIPKLLAVVDSLQKYVFEDKGEEPGDYSFFASMLESNKVDEKFRYLIDFGVPSSAISKLSEHVPSSIVDNVNQYLVDNFQIISDGLLAYEKRLLSNAII